ncbi:MAG: c-type cytochrome, partial [Nitrospirota bacterium]|nr:c-type cytochrome [Nitrospirota bacterium]
MFDSASPPSVPPANPKNKALGAWAAGFVLLITLGAIWKASPPSEPLLNVQKIDPNMVPLATGDEPIQQLFVRAGCPVCHQIHGIAGANGQVGPPLWLRNTGVMRLADPHYRGQAQTVRDYIIESIVSPGVYVVPGFPANTMPVWYGRKLSAAALEKIVSYLEQAMERE